MKWVGYLLFYWLGYSRNGALPQDNQWVIRPNQTTFNRLWDI
ncbi:MAG: hypothetical protein KatS3mg035_2014 [Bacteroidia bacterium]|nr:MAG: hypothetical protein KatS3mg035_2014 [Bacteroidia bacterium]